jgi:hypothetical protein
MSFKRIYSGFESIFKLVLWFLKCQWFESATDLNKIPGHEVPRGFLFSDRGMLALPREKNKKSPCPPSDGQGDFVAMAPTLRIMSLALRDG